MHRLSIFRICLLSVIFTLIAGCVTNPPRQAADIVLNAQTGGSVVRFSPSSQVLAFGGWSGQLLLLDPADGRVLNSLGAHTGNLNGIAFLDDQHLVTAGFDGYLRYWHVSGRLLKSVPTGSPVTALAFSGNRLITGHHDGRVRFWSAPDLHLEQELNYHQGSVKAIAIATAGERFATSGNAGDVYLVDARYTASQLPSAPTDTWTLVFTPDDLYLLGGGWFDLFRWSTETGALEILPTEHQGIIKSIGYAPGNVFLTSISRQTDSSVNFLDPRTGETLRRFQKHGLCGGDIDISSDGRFLATTSDDSSIHIWHLDNRVTK